MTCETEGRWLHRFPWVREQFVAQGGILPEQSADELGRFFHLTRVVDKPLALISKNVDLLWHTFIQDTECYSKYCFESYGEVIHHRSRTPSRPVPDSAVRNFFDAYEDAYGEVP